MVTQANEILLGYNFIFGQIFEDNHYIFGVNDEGTQLEGVEEVPPGVVYNLVVVFFLGEGEVGLVDEEVEDCFKVGFIFLEGGFYGLTLEQIGKFSVDGFLPLYNGFIIFLYFLSESFLLLFYFPFLIIFFIFFIF